jgi:hypothetical protein
MKREALLPSASTLLAILLMMSNCNLFEKDTNDPGLSDLSNLIENDIPGFSEIAFAAAPAGSLDGDEDISGGYAFRELFTPDSSRYILQIIMNFKDKSVALERLADYGSLKIMQPYVFADEAIIAREINRKDMIGVRVFMFVRDQFLVFIGTGTLDSTLAAPDSVVLISAARDIDNSIIHSGFKSATAEVHNTGGKNSSDKWTFPGGRTEKSDASRHHPAGESTQTIPLIQKGKEAGSIELKLINEVVGTCERSCPAPQVGMHCILRKIKVQLTGMTLNSDADDTDNIPLLDDAAEVYAGINLWVYFDCDGATSSHYVILKVGPLGSIKSGGSLDPSNEIPKDLCDITDCQCDFHPDYPMVGYSITAYIYDDDNAKASELVAKGEKLLADLLALSHPEEALVLGTAAAIKEELKKHPPTGGGPDPYEGVEGVEFVGKGEVTGRKDIPR